MPDPKTPEVVLLRSWTWSLTARNLSVRTVELYAESVESFARFLGSDPTSASRRDVESFLAWLRDNRAPATAHSRYGALKRFYEWCVEEGELSKSPMERIKAPFVPMPETKVFTSEELKRLLHACSGKSFEERRTYALVMVFIDTGCRLGEVAALTVDDVDFANQCLHVMGKGRKPRIVPFGEATRTALDRYVRLRKKHPRASSPWFFLTRHAHLTRRGGYHLIARLGKKAGVEGAHPHRFRHTFADAWLSAGGQEHDLIRLAGWSSTKMLARYGAEQADKRAREAHRRLSPADRL